MPDITKIQLKDAQETPLYPKTSADIVEYGETTVDAKLGDLQSQISAITHPEYTIAELGTAAEGYLKTYQLYKDNVAVQGSTINIPKDFLVKSATSGVVVAADKEEGGKFADDPNYQIGDAYLDFVINVKTGTAADEHVYVNVADLVDVYTAAQGGGLTLSSNAFSIDYAHDVYENAAAAAADQHAGDEEKAVKSKTIFAAIAAAKAAAQSAAEATAATALGNHTADAVAHLSAQEHSDLTAHLASTNNPHSVTAAQVGAYTTAQADARFVQYEEITPAQGE